MRELRQRGDTTTIINGAREHHHQWRTRTRPADPQRGTHRSL
jgi:hypothetical protein